MLIVDDEPEQLRSIRVGLTARGYKVIEALSGDEALECIRDKPGEVTLIITDYSCPSKGMRNWLSLNQIILNP